MGRWRVAWIAACAAGALAAPILACIPLFDGTPFYTPPLFAALVISTAQAFVLRRFGVRAWHWIATTTLALATGYWAASYSLAQPILDHFILFGLMPIPTTLLATLIAILILIALAQAAVLPSQWKSRWIIWPLAATVASIAMSHTHSGVISAMATRCSTASEPDFGWSLVSGAAYGLITVWAIAAMRGRDRPMTSRVA